MQNVKPQTPILQNPPRRHYYSDTTHFPNNIHTQVDGSLNTVECDIIGCLVFRDHKVIEK